MRLNSRFLLWSSRCSRYTLNMRSHTHGCVRELTNTSLLSLSSMILINAHEKKKASENRQDDGGQLEGEPPFETATEDSVLIFHSDSAVKLLSLRLFSESRRRANQLQQEKTLAIKKHQTLKQLHSVMFMRKTPLKMVVVVDKITERLRVYRLKMRNHLLKAGIIKQTVQLIWTRSSRGGWSLSRYSIYCMMPT